MATLEPTIYVVTARVADFEEGEKVLAVYTDQALADKYVELYNKKHQWDEKASVKPHAANPHREELQGNKRLFKVIMARDGAILQLESLPLDLSQGWAVAFREGRESFGLSVWAECESHAEDLADMQRKLLIETGQW